MVVHAFKETRLNISGANLETTCVNVKVPPPADDYRRILPNFKSHSSTSRIGERITDAEDIYYTDCVATAGSSFFRENMSNNAQPRSFVWRVLRKGQVIELDPVDFSATKKQQFRKIRIHCPVKIHDNCITISEDLTMDKLVIDFITESSYLYTLSFSFSEFVVDTHGGSISDLCHTLTEENFANWRSIKYPYSFDVKKPHLLYAISANELVASTVDGGLVKMERPTPLGEITTFVFNDPTQSSGLARILPWGHNEKVPGNSGLSLRTAISIVAVPQAEILVTLSINRVLKVWSLKTMTLIEDHEFASSQDLPREQKILIGPSPMNLLRVPEWKNKYKATKAMFLGTFLPLGDGLFKLWQLNLESTVAGQVLVDLGEEFSIVPRIPDSFSTWLVNDFRIQDHTNEVSLSIMWKSNTSSALYQVSLPSQDPVWCITCEPEEVDLQYVNSKSLQDDRTNFFLSKIFGPDGYSCAIIETALQIYGSHYAVQIYNPDKPDYGEMTLQDRLCQTVGTAVSLGYTNSNILDHSAYKADLSQEWTRFDRLCSELQRQGNEVLSLGWDPLLESFLIIKASFVNVVRPALPVELFYYNRSATPDEPVLKLARNALPDVKGTDVDRMLKLVETLYTFRRNFSHIHFNDVMSSIIEDYNPKPKFGTTERIQFLFETHIENQVSEAAYGVLVTSLRDIGDIDSLLELLLSIIWTKLPIGRKDEFALTANGSIVISNALFEVLTTSRLVVCDILLVLIATYSDEEVVAEQASLYTKYLKLLKAINLVFDVMNIISPTNISAPSSQLSFFQTLIFNEFSAHFPSLICNSAFSETLSQLWNYFNIFGDFLSVPRIVSQLLASGNVTQAQEVCSYMTIESLTSFIRAHVFLKNGEGAKAKSLFRTASIELAQRKLSDMELEIVKMMPFTVYTKHSFGEGISKFFVDVSRASLESGLDVHALQFARDAQLNLSRGLANDDGDSVKILELHNLVYSHLFETAIKCSSFDDAYSALVELDMLTSFEEVDEEEDPPRNMREMRIRPYIESLASAMTLKGYGSRLCQYPFIGLTDLVTKFFEEKADHALVRTTLLATNGNGHGSKSGDDDDTFLYYRALYAWNVEHQNFRGGKFTSNDNIDIWN